LGKNSSGIILKIVFLPHIPFCLGSALGFSLLPGAEPGEITKRSDNMPNTIKIKFTGHDVIAYYGPWQYDYGLVLEIQGLMNLPTLTQVHFARKGSPTAEIRIGTYADGVLAVSIPDIMLAQSAEFWAYVYLTDGESAQTIKGIQFYPNARPEPDDTITPGEQNVIDPCRRA